MTLAPLSPKNCKDFSGDKNNKKKQGKLEDLVAWQAMWDMQ